MIALRIKAHNSISARRFDFLKNLFQTFVPLVLFMLPTGAFAAPVTASSLGSASPTFVGPAATGCASGCNLLTGPTIVPSTASFALGSSTARPASRPALAHIDAARVQAAMAAYSGALAHLGMPGRSMRDAVKAAVAAYRGGLRAAPRSQFLAPQSGSELLARLGPASMKCTSAGTSCNAISLIAPGARGVKGLDAVDSGTLPTAPSTGGDIEPPDQGLCAGNGYVVESNNIGEVLFFDSRLQRVSGVIPLDTLMGLTAKGWSSGGDISCNYDRANGGHWFFTEFASASTEASGGPFAGCFAGVANTCYEIIAVTQGRSPYGPYYVYYLNSNYNPAEPGAPYLLNDFTKTGMSRDAFLVFYDEFPLVTPGVGGGGFNGAQEYAFDKTALETGAPTILADGTPNPDFNVAIENMGTLSTPDGTCASDNINHLPGFTCWYSVIPAMPPDPTQFDNSHGGSAFMLDTLDYYGNGDTRLAVFAWTDLSALDSPQCESCTAIRFGGQLLSGVDSYDDSGAIAPQKTGPIPLGDQCGVAGLSVPTSSGPAPTSCPEGGIATNGDNFTQASQGQGMLWGAVSTLISESFPGEALAESHLGAVYYVIDTAGFDRGGSFALAGQNYIAPIHEDLSMPDLIAPDYGRAVLVFTLTGNGGPLGADDGGFYPSTAYVNVLPGSAGVVSGTIHVVDPGQSPDDGFTEYQGYPGPTRPRWGDYSQGVFDTATNKIYFANEYIQYPNCTGSAFSLTLGTCDGTRDAFANWGTSVNSLNP